MNDMHALRAVRLQFELQELTKRERNLIHIANRPASPYSGDAEEELRSIREKIAGIIKEADSLQG